MSNSYNTHKTQVEAARKNNGEFGSYQAGESGASLAPSGAVDHGYDREEAKTMVESEGHYAVEADDNTHAVIESTEAGWDVYTDIGGSKSGDVDSQDDLETALTAFEDRIAYETSWGDGEKNQPSEAPSQRDWFAPPTPPMSEVTDDELASSIDQAMAGKDWRASDVGEVNGVMTFGLADRRGKQLVQVRNDKARGFHEVWDHSADEPRMVSSTTAGYASADQIAARAVEHYDALSAGLDPLEEARTANHYPAGDGLPTSYGFDIREADPEARAAAKHMQSTFGDDYEIEVADTGGGNEMITISGGPEGSAFEARVHSPDGGSLDSSGWTVTGAYQDADGDWVEDDEELLDNAYEIPDSEDLGALRTGIEGKLAVARAKANSS